MSSLGGDPFATAALSRAATDVISSVEGATITEPLSKGVNFTRLRSFVVERFGAGAWDEIVARLTPPERATLDGLLPIGWYPLELDRRLLHAALAVCGEADQKLALEIGRYSAEHDISGIQRMFFRLANPAFLLEKIGDYWSRFHNTGRWTVTRPHGHSALGSLRGWAYPDAAACLRITGYIGRAFELVGAKLVQIDHPRCRCNGREACAFVGNWR